MTRRLPYAAGCFGLAAVLVMCLGVGATADEAAPRPLTDTEMLDVRGLGGNGKCCDNDLHGSTCCVGGCSEQEWDCKKLLGQEDPPQWWCSQQWYHSCGLCVDDSQHPGWTCVQGAYNYIKCVFKKRDPLPADGKCEATENHGVACKTSVENVPCGNKKKCEDGHDDCL